MILRHRKAKPVASSTPKVGSKNLPGYPLYAPSEDIMNRAKRVDADLESVKEDQNKAIKKEINQIPESIDSDEIEPVEKDEFTVTAEDLEALGDPDLSLDQGDDEELRHRTTPVDFSAKDLDIPGSELDDEQEAAGSEDEENNSYSLGGDDHNDLEESKP